MSTIPPSTPPPVQPTETYAGRSLTLKTADWLTDGRLQRLMRAIAGEDEDIRIVGGAVRPEILVAGNFEEPTGDDEEGDGASTTNVPAKPAVQVDDQLSKALDLLKAKTS